MALAHPSESIQLFEQQAAEFAAFAPRSWTWRLVERPAFDFHLKDAYATAGRVLDLGCGSGRITELLARRSVLPRQITGVDGSERLLGIARREQPDVAFVRQDIRCLDLPARDFSLVTAHMVFQALPDYELQATLRGAYEHMAPGGILFFITTHPLRQIEGDASLYLKRRRIPITTPWDMSNVNFVRPVSDYVNYTASAGFRIDYVDELGVSEAVRAECPARYARHAQFGAIRIAIKACKQ